MERYRILEKEILRNKQWTFDEKVSEIFDWHIRRSVPLYDELHHMLVDLAEPFLKSNAVVCDLGTSTGETIFNLNKRYPEMNIMFYGIDNSLPMLKKAKEKCKGIKNVKFICSNIQDISIPKSDLIISLYTLQFIRISERNRIIDKIFKALKNEGGFIISEKIVNQNIFLDELFVKLYERMKKRNGFSDEEIEAKRVSLKGIMEPITYEDNYKMLKESGFSLIETFFRWHNFVGIIAIKK
ncbi:methyltransferase domain-containing protein [Candidatus Poribacteria bacterium]|nr:methyltransferase domain-containing protein [Candidatus Poribacteria bacterium]